MYLFPTPTLLDGTANPIVSGPLAWSVSTYIILVFPTFKRNTSFVNTALTNPAFKNNTCCLEYPYGLENTVIASGMAVFEMCELIRTPF